MILGSTCGTRTTTGIGSTVHGVRQHLGLKVHVVGHHSRSQMMRHSLQRIQDQLQVVVIVKGNDLERSKDFRHGTLEMFRLHHLFQWDLNGGRLTGTVLGRDLVVPKLLASPQHLGTWDARQALCVAQKGLRRHRQSRTGSQVFQVTLGGIGLHLFQETRSFPVLVNKDNGLCRTLLSDCCVSVLVALPRHVIHVGNIRTNHPAKERAKSMRFDPSPSYVQIAEFAATLTSNQNQRLRDGPCRAWLQPKFHRHETTP
mmetsp:Transcript_1987/g.3935  ORF Transcript_1987/g.3935 Transcript_1987/m.3935 type:complete len:257 (-) Transcript_1987:1003-1773(-)